MRTKFGAERLIDAPAEVIYHLIADYRVHHRPEGFLPPAFSDQEILRGGVGAGTELRYTLTAGGRPRVVTSQITEPEPGRRLVETAPAIETTFTVEPGDGGTLVRFDTVLDESGVQGWLTWLFAARLIAPIYEDELDRLEELAMAHPSPVRSEVAA
jgi:Polyketide cyclase / dehydrase and lipid transport